jgi:hypothetical protein
MKVKTIKGKSPGETQSALHENAADGFSQDW